MIIYCFVFISPRNEVQGTQQSAWTWKLSNFPDRGHRNWATLTDHRSKSVIGQRCSVSESEIWTRYSVSMSVIWKRFSISMSTIWKRCSTFKELQHKNLSFFSFFLYLEAMNQYFDYHSGFRKRCTTTYEKLADWFRIPLRNCKTILIYTIHNFFGPPCSYKYLIKLWLSRTSSALARLAASYKINENI